MRRTIITAAAAIALTTISPARAAGNEALRDQLCAAMAELAENMAWVHQNGMSLSQALETSNSLAGTNDQMRELGRSMVIMIWENQRYLTPDMQERAVLETRDAVHLKCLREAPRH